MHFNLYPGYECSFVHVCIADTDLIICTTPSRGKQLTSLLHDQLEYEERYLLVPQ